MTNGDRIRQMSNEELAEWLDTQFGTDVGCRCCVQVNCYKYSDCKEGIKAYLESEEQ